MTSIRKCCIISQFKYVQKTQQFPHWPLPWNRLENFRNSVAFSGKIWYASFGDPALPTGTSCPTSPSPDRRPLFSAGRQSNLPVCFESHPIQICLARMILYKKESCHCTSVVITVCNDSCFLFSRGRYQWSSRSAGSCPGCRRTHCPGRGSAGPASPALHRHRRYGTAPAPAGRRSG